MKKLLAALLCLMLLPLCACESAPAAEESQASESESISDLSQRKSDPDLIPTNPPDENTPTEGLATSVPSTDISTSKGDPYSYVIKAYRAMEKDPESYEKAIYPAVYGDAAKENEARLTKEFAQGFRMRKKDPFQVIWYGVIMAERREFFYALHDLDSNGTEELLLGASGFLFDIYAIQQGIAVQQNSFGIFQAPPVLLNDGTIQIDYMDDDTSFGSIYYRFQSEALEFYASLSYHAEDDHNYYTAAGRESPITMEEYDRLKEEMEGDGQVVDLDWKPLAEYKP